MLTWISPAMIYLYMQFYEITRIVKFLEHFFPFSTTYQNLPGIPCHHFAFGTMNHWAEIGANHRIKPKPFQEAARKRKKEMKDEMLKQNLGNKIWLGKFPYHNFPCGYFLEVNWHENLVISEKCGFCPSIFSWAFMLRSIWVEPMYTGRH